MDKKETESNEFNEKEEEVIKQERRHRHSHQGGNASGAVILIGLGIIFLLNNFGYLPWNIWAQLWRFWPIFLVIWGIQTILGHSRLANTISTIIALLLLLVVLVLATSSVSSSFTSALHNQFPWWPLATSEISTPTHGGQKTEEIRVASEDYKNVKSRNLDLQVGSGSYSIQTDTSANYFDVTAHYFEDFGQPTVTSNQESETLKVEFNTNRTGGHGFFNFGQTKYDFKIGNPETVTDLKITQGSGDGHINLSNLTLSSLAIEMGSGSLEATLSNKAIPSSVDLQMGSGSMTIKLPKDVGIKANYEMGSGNLKISGTNLTKTGTYTSPNFQSAKSKLDLKVHMGSGSLTISS